MTTRTVTYQVNRSPQPTPPPIDPEPVRRWVGWYALHRAAGGRQDVPDGMPAVLSPINPVVLKMTASIQFMGFDLMQSQNEWIDGEDWSQVHKHDRAWCNNQGFYKPGDPRANYILGKDLDSPLPKYDKMQRFMQGSFLRADVAFSVIRMVQNTFNLIRTARSAIRMDAAAWMGAVRGLTTANVLRCRPGVHGIDARVRPYPSSAQIFDENKFCYSVSIGQKDPRRIDHFPQGEDPFGNQHPVIEPFIFDRDIDFPREWFRPWDETFPPDPTVIYP